MLSELQNKTLKTLNTKFFNLSQDKESLSASKSDIQYSMMDLHKKYCNPASVDRLYELRNDVKDIHVTMKQNLSHMISNIDSAQVYIIHNKATREKISRYKKHGFDI